MPSQPDVAPLICLSPDDNVGVARSLIPAGTPLALDTARFSAAVDIPSGHKVALRRIEVAETVRKYGQAIGVATADIMPGDHVHLHNMAMQDTVGTHDFATDGGPTPLLPASERKTFMGYLRADGQVGTRNYIGIVTSVNCSATVARAVADHFNRSDELAAWPNVDGVVALTHGSGCAMSTKTEGYAILQRVLSGYAQNPNFAGILMIGLGCETNQIAPIVEKFGLKEGAFLRTMTIQQLGGTRRTVKQASEMIREMLPEISAMQREEVPLSGLKLALQCGGSDGYSGISANPALGVASDLVVRNGGTSVLSETPEIYGAEHLLTRRAVTPAVAQKLMDRIAWWRAYTERHEAELNNNPSHGNKLGGLTTILEKSLGAVAKGGTMPLMAVYEYAELVRTPGFVFMDTPGYDPVAVTGQVAGGCNLIVFTTGRGSVSGFKPAPCIKVATNTEMYTRMDEDMDINCGGIVTGDDSIEQAGQRLFDMILDVASGRHTMSEDQGFGDSEFVPWQIGAVT
ncbi:UxaA family hydrolase [Puniceibacterium sp. IMCC21224]|uniref:UxaA family hydrolase n=1 Tax=Puniceibacterium sp. IMCC21224 TaxID=1618204 RepID=UPI00064DDFB7|nr:altronate dehydratase family protein [Puniceibacterium sp. IMCC21224]KMK64972.1 altronate dehydratase [Puniceibacterium sp. IMCC21224]